MALKPIPGQGGQGQNFYLISVAPYYAANADALTSDASPHATMFSNNGGDSLDAGINIGIKMMHGSYQGHITTTTSTVPHANGTNTWKPIGASNAPTAFQDEDYLLPSTWNYGVIPGFGPYDLTDLTPPYGLGTNEASGSVLIFTTGSDVLSGTNNGAEYSIADTRAFNVLFWVTGSSQGENLAEQVTGITISNGFDENDRKAVYNAGYGMFQAYYDPTGKQFSWWPAIYTDSDERALYYWNG